MKTQLTLALLFPLMLLAQDYEVQRSMDVPYATNISILSGMPTEVELLMDVYQPADGPPGPRPVVICLHGGALLPQLFNGLATGSRGDSAIVETCTRLARRGFVALAPTYRMGWRPLSTSAAIRKSSYFQALYRAMQDLRSCIRYLRRTVAEEGNPYQAAPNRIVVWGYGTGARIALAAGYLDRYDELFLPAFIDPGQLTPFVDTASLGSLNGTTTTPLCIANHSDYPSHFNLIVNVGGSIGETTWMNASGAPSCPPPMLSFHSITDPLQPYTYSIIIAPPVKPLTLPYYGSRLAQDTANRLGLTAVLDEALDDTAPLSQYLNQYVESLKDIPFQPPGHQWSTLATEHLYPFIPPPGPNGNPRPEFNPWDWWDEAAIIATNPDGAAMLNIEDIFEHSLAFNPNMSPQKGRAYLDTIFAYFTPRFEALMQAGPPAGPCFFTDTEEPRPSLPGLSASPNPASGYTLVQADGDAAIREITVYNLLGQQVRRIKKIGLPSYTLHRGELARGTYLVQARLDKGTGKVKVVFY